MSHKQCKFPSTETVQFCKLTPLQFKFWAKLDSSLSKWYLCEGGHKILSILNSVYRFYMWIIHILPTYSHFTASVCCFAWIPFVDFSNVYFFYYPSQFLFYNPFTQSHYIGFSHFHTVSLEFSLFWVCQIFKDFLHTMFPRNFSCHIQILFYN